MLIFAKADNQPYLSQGIEYTIPNVSDYLLSPDGTQVAYIKSPYGDTYNCEIWVADKVGAELINHEMILDDAEWNGLDDWQGDWILYRIRREPGGPANYEYGRNELWKMKPDGSEKTQITDTFTRGNGIRIAYWNHWYDNRGTVVWGRFIPGTNLVYFHAHNGNGWYKTFVVVDDGLIIGDPSTFNWYPISLDHTWRPCLDPTGNKLLWGRQTNYWRPTTFKTCNVDGSDRTTIKAFTQNIGVTVLVDGNTFIWAQDGNIHAMDMDGTNERPVLVDGHTNTQWNYDPTDAQGLIMGSDRSDGNMHIYTIKLDGTIEQLTEGPYMDEYPTLSPDGNYLSYLRLPEDFVKEGYPRPYPYELVIKSLVVEATVDLKPETLNRNSQGKWVTVFIGLPEGYDVNDIDIESVCLDGLFRADSSPTGIDDHDGDGRPDLMVKFDREDLIELLGQNGENVLITICGDLLDGQRFEGTCTIRVIH